MTPSVERRRQRLRLRTMIVLAMGIVAVVATYATIWWLLSGLSNYNPGGSVITMAPVFSPSSDIGNCGARAQTVNVTLNPSIPYLSTQDFTAVLLTPSGGQVPVFDPGSYGNAGPRCDPISTSGWYGILWNDEGSPQALFVQMPAIAFPTGPTFFAWPGATLPYEVQAGGVFEVISGPNLDVTQDTFGVEGINGALLVGTIPL